MANKKKTTTSKINPSLFTNKVLGLVDRDREVKQLMYALFTQEHMLLMGKPGTAKSQFAMNAFKTIDGAEIFNIHLTKQTTEEYVFGPLNIIELKKGNMVHNTKDSILTADFAFIDEFFDASDVLLRSLLGVLNERSWMKGSQKVDAKLHTAILTSNYQRENEVTEAILDRIIFKAEVNPITAKTKRRKVYKNYLNEPNFTPPKVLDLKKLQDFTKKVVSPNSVDFPKHILDAFDNLTQEFIKESNKYISQRTANKALKVLKVAALLNDRDKVEYNDLEELRYVYCVLNRRMEEEIFDAVYEKCVGKAEEERIVLADLKDIKDKVDKMPEDFDKLDDQEFIDKMRELNELRHMLENDMNFPTDKSKGKRDSILDRIRHLVGANRDKLFKRKKNNDDSKKKQ